MFNFEEGLWRSCADCNYEDDGTDIGPVKSKSSSLMVPRLPFTEWTGFETGDSAQQMIGASRAWPGLTLLTLADIKTTSWLVENRHITQLERIIFTTDLDTQSVNTEVENIKRLAATVSIKADDQIFAPPEGNLITSRSEMVIHEILFTLIRPCQLMCFPTIKYSQLLL